jgi:tRNA nucleotidyltransferase (CCA-adding enzyme)
VRFAVLTHDLGKALTPAALLPKHHGHEERSEAALAALCARLPVPRRYQDLAMTVARYHGLVHRAAELRPGTVQQLIEKVDGLRRPERFELFLLACEADARGRLGLESRYYAQADLLRRALAAARSIKGADLASELSGAALGEALRRQQAEAIADALRSARRS